MGFSILVFVTINPSLALPDTSDLYPSGISISTTLYSISLVSFISFTTGRSSNLCFQLFSSLKVIVL